MLQFYFLSVLLNLIVGFILFYKKDIEEAASSVNEDEPLDNSDDDLSFLDEDYQKKDSVKKNKSNVISVFFNSESFINDSLFQLVLGILTVFTALIKLLSPVSGIPFLGDLLPAIVGLFGGIAILINYYIENSSSELDLPDFLQLIVIDFQKYVGIACIIVSIVHFIVPGVLFL